MKNYIILIIVSGFCFQISGQCLNDSSITNKSKRYKNAIDEYIIGEYKSDFDLIIALSMKGSEKNSRICKFAGFKDDKIYLNRLKISCDTCVLEVLPKNKMVVRNAEDFEDVLDSLRKIEFFQLREDSFANIDEISYESDTLTKVTISDSQYYSFLIIKEDVSRVECYAPLTLQEILPPNEKLDAFVKALFLFNDRWNELW